MRIIKTVTVIFIFLSLSSLKGNWKPVSGIKTCPYGGDFTIIDGEIWQVDFVKDSIFVFKDGKIKEKYPSPGFESYAIHSFRDTLLISDDNYIYFMRNEETIHRSIYTPVSNISGITNDGENLWVSGSSGEIFYLSERDGTTIEKIDDIGTDIKGLSYSNKYLWATSRYRDEIYMIDPERKEIVNIMPAPGPYPAGISVKGEDIFIYDFQNDSIYKYRMPKEKEIVKSDSERVKIKMRWELFNNGPGVLGEIKVFFAIPESRENQKILNEVNFSREPDSIVFDRYGQKVAKFNCKDIKPRELKVYESYVHAELYRIDHFVKPENIKSLNDIPLEIREKFLGNTEKFGIENERIQKAVEGIVRGEENNYWKFRKIVDFVGDKVEYERVGGWDVAPEILRRGKGSCSEYAYLTIAMLRAAGIPAKFVGAVVQRGDESSLDGVFHRWVEVYLPGYGWISVDPGVSDSENRRRRALGVGHLSPRYLITTEGGGDSEFMGWSYNFNEILTDYDPRTDFRMDSYAIWEPYSGGKNE